MQTTDRVLGFRPPRIAMTLAAAAIAIHWLLPVTLHAANLPAALAAGLAGSALMLRAWWLFRRADTAICPTAASSELITHDVYALTRNPMYLAMTLMMFAIALATGAAAAYAAAAVNAAILNHHFIPFEESKLAQTFGDAYRDYQRRTRRWL